MKKSAIYVLAMTVTLCAMFSCICFAGSINANEQRVISAASGTFEYNGTEYAVVGYAKSQLRNYLMSDDIDLTSEQADRAISEMFGNIGRGIEEGYLYSLSGGDGRDGDGDVDVPGSEYGSSYPHEGESAGSGGHVYYKPASTIKDTGFNFNILLLILAVAVAVLICGGYITKKNSELFKYCMPVGFAVVIIAAVLVMQRPVLNLFELELSAAAEQGYPGNSYVQVDREFVYPEAGSRYGMIENEDTGLDTPLYYGDTDRVFEQGAGQYTGSGIPGEGRTIIVGGHDLTYFAPLENIKKGQTISISTAYGQYEYKVTGTDIADWDDTSAYTGFEGETLIMYTCYPFGSVLGNRSQRYFVYAEKTSGSGPEEIR